MNIAKLISNPVVKQIASLVVGAGAAKIVKNVVEANVKPQTLLDQTAVLAASAAIGGLVAKAAKKYTDEKIDEAAELVGELQELTTTLIKLRKVNKGKKTFEELDLDPKLFAKNAKGKYRQIPETDEQELIKKLDRINRGESTFEKEELIQTGYFQDTDTGNWIPNLTEEPNS